MKNVLTGKEMNSFVRFRELTYKGEDFVVPCVYWAEKEGEEGFTTDKEDELALNHVKNQYRLKHRIPDAEELVRAREKYGLTAARMATILGISPNAYRQYEDGEIPSLSNARLLDMVLNVEDFKRLVERSTELAQKDQEKILVRIHQLMEEKKNQNYNWEVAFLPSGRSKVEEQYQGYRTATQNRTSEMFYLIAKKLKPGKTKLNKLMFYIDFFHYKHFGRSISGNVYRSIEHGPVMNNYDRLLDAAEIDGYIEVKVKEVDGDLWMHQVITAKERTLEYLTEQEQQTIEHILKVLGKKSTNELVELSHQEQAWKKHRKGNELIDYNEAFGLVGV